MEFTPPAAVLLAIGGGIGVYGAALALGFRHGIDWDHIAAITDITSAASSGSEEKDSWLIGEPGLSLINEEHHLTHSARPHDESGIVLLSGNVGVREESSGIEVASEGCTQQRSKGSVQAHKSAFALGTLYALGHGFVVSVLGILAIVASEVLPDWVDPIMEKVVGVTLLLLAAYLFYSVYRYFKAGDEFKIRSRWMLVFVGAANAWRWIRSRVGTHEHQPAVVQQQYGFRSSFGIGIIHGVGAETGTQALIIAGAVGATSKTVAVLSLLVFVCGLLISNSFITLMSTVGFVSAQQKQTIYLAAGLLAAVFSLVLGIVFLFAQTGILPDLDPYFRWVGGPA